jgi:hypothetical protein
MLMKLIKYDIRYNWRWYMGLFGGLAVFGLSGALVPHINKIGADDFHNPVVIVSTIVYAVTLCVITAIIVQCMVAAVQGYKKGMYGNWGYLTMTLPVKHTQILTSKFVTACFWFNAVSLMSVLSGLLFAYLADSLEFTLNAPAWEMVWDILKGWFIVNLCILSIIGAVYLSVTVANVSLDGRRLGLWGGITGFVVWMALWGFSLFHAINFHYHYPSSESWLVSVHFALFLAAAYAINAALIKRRVCLV